MNTYKCLNQNEFQYNEYKIVPIRYEDRLDIMKWRNEQIYHLRQEKPLTEKGQENYFKNTVSELFIEEKPNQILFSLLKNNICIGYGGLVHINWIDLHAEISFIMDTELESDNFEEIWSNFLYLIDKVAFNDLKIHKLNTFAYDLRPHLYDILEKNNYKKEAILKEHKYFNFKFIDVIVHAKINKNE
jgi:RimJ/RimL family protein N-acetyltransferase